MDDSRTFEKLLSEVSKLSVPQLKFLKERTDFLLKSKLAQNATLYVRFPSSMRPAYLANQLAPIVSYTSHGFPIVLCGGKQWRLTRSLMEKVKILPQHRLGEE